MEKVLWKDARAQIKAIHPALFKVIDELSPDDEHYLYRLEYPYGSLIVDRGTFLVPNYEKHIVPLSHSTIPKKIEEELGYSRTIPLGLVVENSIEASMLSKDRVIPSSIVKQGQLISLWRVLDEGASFHTGRFWNIYSGSRSICMIPKVTDASSYKGLKNKFGLKLHIPQKLFDHWELFTAIANHPNFPQPWKSVIYFFPKKWLQHKTDKTWAPFYLFLHSTVWQSSAFRRNQFIFDFAFSRVQESKNLKPNPYLADTVRHLIAIGSGSVPAFVPAIDDTAAPISGLQQVYLEDYGLKKYAPIIMHLHHFSQSKQRPVYYSFQIPTTTIFSPKSRKVSSAMVEIHEVKYIMETLLSEILKQNLEVEDTPLFELAKLVKYDYFHAEKDQSAEIRPALEIEKIDPNFTKTLINSIEYIFPEFSPFFRGCIAVSNTT